MVRVTDYGKTEEWEKGWKADSRRAKISNLIPHGSTMRRQPWKLRRSQPSLPIDYRLAFQRVNPKLRQTGPSFRDKMKMCFESNADFGSNDSRTVNVK